MPITGAKIARASRISWLRQRDGASAPDDGIAPVDRLGDEGGDDGFDQISGDEGYRSSRRLLQRKAGDQAQTDDANDIDDEDPASRARAQKMREAQALPEAFGEPAGHEGSDRPGNQETRGGAEEDA